MNRLSYKMGFYLTVQWIHKSYFKTCKSDSSLKYSTTVFLHSQLSPRVDSAGLWWFGLDMNLLVMLMQQFCQEVLSRFKEFLREPIRVLTVSSQRKGYGFLEVLLLFRVWAEVTKYIFSSTVLRVKYCKIWQCLYFPFILFHISNSRKLNKSAELIYQSIYNLNTQI